MDQGRGLDEPDWRAGGSKARCLSVEVTRGVTVARSNSFKQPFFLSETTLTEALMLRERIS